VLVELEPPRKSAMEALAGAETAALRSEFKTAIAAYLATAAPAVGPRDLDQLIAFDAQTPAEIALFGQDTFEAAAAGPSLEPAKSAAGRATARRLAVTELDRMFATGGVAAIVAETGAPAPVVDLANGTASFGSPSTLPAVAGYPHLTVPMGQVGGLPVGLSLIGPRWSEARLLAYGYAFEQAAKLQLRPRFLPSVAMEPRFAAALDPQ
jgi:amidase